MLKIGDFATLTGANKAILKWIDVNGYRCSGPEREVYLQPRSTPATRTTRAR